ncbi:MAG TPA: uroporphyrinogen-III C-methyltransferase [Thermoanaerobaculia bacterium]|nr:uroporphyrinogen-III C-methyltransferase [Thermoanaerobaculia bacterium]
MTGKVFLVGAGPGDPGLLTMRAAELIASADVIALDALVSDAIASRIPPHVEVLPTGKRAGAHAMAQEEINALLIAEARKGRRVVRLKGGDPFVFGRGGEEAIALTAAGIPVEVVPGISSAIAGPAYAGIPVTHRSCATSLTLVTAHESEVSTGVAWSALAASNGTLIFLMGLGNLSLVTRKLLEYGMAAETAVAVISKATTPGQKTVTGTLETIERAVANAQLEAPALIVVGDVVNLRDAIAPRSLLEC